MYCRKCGKEILEKVAKQKNGLCEECYDIEKGETKGDFKKKILRGIIVVLIIIGAMLFILTALAMLDNSSRKELKPIIYLYPTEETEVSVTVDKPQNFTTTYPKYIDGWKVVAKPDGTLIDCKTGRSLYALYWEGKREKKPKLETGFVVKREDTVSFLEEKLEILGLNEREAEEFIIYWLPKLEKHPYNWIYFETKEEIEKSMKLEISPKPDVCIRVMMDWKGLNQKISIPEQVLERKERSGYTAVEWGGTEVK